MKCHSIDQKIEKWVLLTYLAAKFEELTESGVNSLILFSVTSCQGTCNTIISWGQLLWLIICGKVAMASDQ